MTCAQHAGVQLAKMSPFRSYVVTTASTLSSIVAVGLHLGDGVNSYINVSLLAACDTYGADSHSAEVFHALAADVATSKHGVLSCCLATLHGFCSAKLLVLHGLFGPFPHSLLKDQLRMHSEH